MRKFTIIKHRPKCWYCGSDGICIRWTTVFPGGGSRWVCLWHTWRHLRT